MPWVSQAQRAWAHAHDEPWAAEWDAATPKGAKLPRRVSSRKSAKKARRRAARS